MQHIEEIRVRPELKEVVEEASQALSRLDAERLEELAFSCHALNRCLTADNAVERAARAREAREAARAMAVFARVMEATRANISLMNRMGKLRAGTLEYGPGLTGNGS
ncbi:MAG: hypothetical protein KGM96_00915 [Acidobacteriota bacterium]|nr:hypothetical protein [Acidobacteriota bacterium]